MVNSIIEKIDQYVKDGPPPADGIRVKILQIDFGWEETNYENSSLAIFPTLSGWENENRSTLAYSIKDTADAVANKKLKIRAKFQKSTPNEYIQVRAKSIPLDVVDIFSGKIIDNFPGQDALGTIGPEFIYFSDQGYSVYRGSKTLQPMALVEPQFPNLGVGIYDVNWLWEFRVLSSKSTVEEEVWEDVWRPITVTKHRVFVTLDTPKFPWSPYMFSGFRQDPPFPLAVWTHALFIACKWAKGAKNTDEAAKMITDRLFDSGRFSYDTDSNYSDFDYLKRSASEGGNGERVSENKMRFFQLSKVIERILGENGLGQNANCMDCAMIVSSLANVLGCNLQVGKLQATDCTDTRTDPSLNKKNQFEVNPIIAIGKESVEDTMNGLISDDKHCFSFHSIAWQASDAEDGGAFNDPEMKVYDACVRFEIRGDDGSTTLVPASGLEFGTEQDANSYGCRLATESEHGRVKCIPQQVTVEKYQIC